MNLGGLLISIRKLNNFCAFFSYASLIMVRNKNTVEITHLHITQFHYFYKFSCGLRQKTEIPVRLPTKSRGIVGPFSCKLSLLICEKQRNGILCGIRQFKKAIVQLYAVLNLDASSIVALFR